ncbi:MAG: helix-turn-helix domain-containing protein [Deltaproteobacteria bacterium]|nr:helix-turn-helix domain-containing protein [Deltaproteobacteria bacterium]
MDSLPPKSNLRVAEVANFLGCSQSIVYKLINGGDLPAFRKNNLIRIPRETFLNWYNSHIENEANGQR